MAVTASILTAIYHMLRMGRCIRTPVANTLTAAPMTSKNEAWSNWLQQIVGDGSAGSLSFAAASLNPSLTLATPWRSSP
jgi:hypothetical protein